MLAIWSLVSLPFLNPAWTSGSSQFMYCWSLVWRMLSITLLVCEMSAIVQYFEHSLAFPFFGIGMKTDLFKSHSKMSGSTWVITPSWLSGSLRSLYRSYLCMKCSLGISNFLEEISGLSFSIIFLHFFALITEEGFLISPHYSLELSI